MFDFIFSNKRNILKNPEKFIIFVKKLLPKYANSLPDSAAISIFREIKKLKGANNLIIETGVGASTIVLFVAVSKPFINNPYWLFKIAKNNGINLEIAKQYSRCFQP